MSSEGSDIADGLSARSGHTAVAFPAPPNTPTVAAVVTLFGGSNLTKQEGFNDTHQLLVGATWGAIIHAHALSIFFVCLKHT